MKRKIAAILTAIMLLSVFSMGNFAEEDSTVPTASFDEKVTLNDAEEVMPIHRIILNIETTFSQLAEQLNINKVLTRSMLGLIARLRTKILSHTLCYTINKILGNNISLGHIKELMFG